MRRDALEADGPLIMVLVVLWILTSYGSSGPIGAMGVVVFACSTCRTTADDLSLRISPCASSLDAAVSVEVVAVANEDKGMATTRVRGAVLCRRASTEGLGTSLFVEILQFPKLYFRAVCCAHRLTRGIDDDGVSNPHSYCNERWITLTFPHKDAKRSSPRQVQSSTLFLAPPCVRKQKLEMERKI